MTSWIENTGEQPTGLLPSEIIEAVLVCGERVRYAAKQLDWSLIDSERDITYWRKSCEQTLETAYDVPPKDSSYITLSPSRTEEISYYTAPRTKSSTIKKSVPQLVSDSFNQLSGKNITVAEVESIITLHEVLKKMEN